MARYAAQGGFGAAGAPISAEVRERRRFACLAAPSAPSPRRLPPNTFRRAQVDRARRRGEPRVDPEALKQRVGLQNAVLITIGFVAMTAIGSIADATMGAASA